MTIGDTVIKKDCELSPILGVIIEDWGNKVVIIDADAETDDDRLEFHKSELEVI